MSDAARERQRRHRWCGRDNALPRAEGAHPDQAAADAAGARRGGLDRRRLPGARGALGHHLHGQSQRPRPRGVPRRPAAAERSADARALRADRARPCRHAESRRAPARVARLGGGRSLHRPLRARAFAPAATSGAGVRAPRQRSRHGEAESRARDACRESGEGTAGGGRGTGTADCGAGTGHRGRASSTGFGNCNGSRGSTSCQLAGASKQAFGSASLHG
mmetsp:Transcript_21303/g.68692  ORF Transcript_21303/g.68692 Transcript_21303/m.68692 type:complete len:220 (-) Transcript_21303:369-1028(-)